MSHHENDHADRGQDGQRPPADARPSEPERPETLQEEKHQAVHQQEDPPKAEGTREDVEEDAPDD